jgi:photosystem II stability/assembly factor-like uncharacterized protein
MNTEGDFEQALRASLAEQAGRAPAAGPVVHEILMAVERPAHSPRRRTRQWGTWTLPLISAAAVVAVAAALVGVAQIHHSANQLPAVRGTTAVPTPTSAAPAPSSPAPSTTAVPSTTAGILNVVGLRHFGALDLTFVSPSDGWILGSAECVTVPGTTCAAMVRTTDGGRTWRSLRQPPADVPLPACADPCIDHLRFANTSIGYAFGPSALFMTTDGGASWHAQPGGASALETLAGNVIRVSTACNPGCPYTVQTALLGSTSWHPASLPGAQAANNSGVSLTRTGNRAFIDIYGHVTGGAGNATSVLYSSVDNGASWARRGEPCPQVGNEVDSTALASASDGSVTVLCTPRGGTSPQFTSTSTDAGATFHPGTVGALGSAPVTAIGAASGSVLLVANGDAYRSTDSGASFARLGANGGSTPGDAIWFGFETDTVGRAVSEGGSTIWTTLDAGLTWSRFTFPT